MLSIFKTTLIHLIKATLWVLDSDHRNPEDIAMDDTKKFTHIVDQDFQSDFGHVSHAFRTVPYELYELRTESHRLLAADRHRVVREDSTCAWLEDLVPGDRIKTANGSEAVVSCRNLGIRTHMYCISVETPDVDDPMNHLYYSDGILSHNTTCAAAFLLWKAMFTPDTTILLAANKQVQALEIMDRIRYAYENLEEYNWLRAGIVEYNKGTIKFDNGSRIVSRATTMDAGRGLSISLLYLDEFSFVRPSIAAEFWTAIQPTLSTGGGCIVTSTPNNDEDQFAQIWKGANQTIDDYGNERTDGLGKNGFKAVKYTWDKHPERDEVWADEQRSLLGIDKFRREFNCEFVTEDETLINNLALVALSPEDEIFKIGEIRWYQEPKPNHIYTVALDPSLGTGGDYAAIQVFEMPSMVQVAEWRHNKTAIKGQISLLRDILNYIHYSMLDDPSQDGEPEIYWTVENNSLGEAALVVIEDTGEENFPGTFVHEPKRSGGGRHRKGLNTTNKSKLTACSRLKSLIESDRMHVRSKALLKELKNYVRTGAGFAAKWGETDDLISATLLCLRVSIMVAEWDPDIGDRLKDIVNTDDSDSSMAPLPFSF